MKKRIMSLFLVISLVLTMFTANIALAQEGDISQLTIAQPTFSQWATEDLVVGDTYGIYPQRWYTSNMNKPISNSQIRVLLAGVRRKLVKSDCVIETKDVRYNISDNMTVEEVLNTFYILLSAYEFESDVGIIDGENAVAYMAKTDVFTGNEGELSLDDICTIEQACVIATRLVTHLYDALDAASKGFLWEINSGDNTVYLLGSIHIANYDIYPFSNKMLKAFAESDALAVELDILNAAVDANMLLMEYGVYYDGTSLKDHVSDETYQKTLEVAGYYGYTEELISMFKPWAIYTMFNALITTSGSVDEIALASSLGIDMKFIIDAYLTGKPVVELESYDFQLRLLDSFSDELAEYLLDGTMDALLGIGEGSEDTGKEILNIMLEYWHDGNVEAFMEDIAPLLVAAEIPDMDEDDKRIHQLMEEYVYKLITERDLGMADKIDEFLKAEGSTTYFVVVGTGHYISEYSVIDILEEKGYEINQVK